MSKLSPERAAIFLAALALVSALLSSFAPLDPWEIITLGPGPERVPLLPGIYFGLVLCVGLYLWETKDAIKLAAALIAVVIAWICAWKTAVEVHRILDGNASGDIPYSYAIAGFIAGLVGSLITVAGISFASRDSRTFGTWIRTILIGAVAGLLLQLQSTLLPLLLVWQTAVAASIAYGLVKSKWGVRT
jgi:hypothetical protein